MDETTRDRVGEAINAHSSFRWDEYHGKWGAFMCGCGHHYKGGDGQVMAENGRSLLYQEATEHRIDAVMKALED